MSQLFADRLIDSIQAKGAPICVGIDPILDMLPEAIAGDPRTRNANDREAAIDAVFAFTTALLRVVAQHVPIVKFQSAYFEQFLWEGVEAYYSLIAEARELGLLVIGDVKRGDIGSTAAAYAAGHLADPVAAEDNDIVIPDAITVNPMLGLDTLEPFFATAKTFDKGLFVLVRTSNPGSAELQDAKLADGRTWSEMLADKLAPIAAAEGLVGTYGFSSIGAVVGATQPQTMASLRERLPRSFFLLPGYGAQGATADMTRAAFRDGQGALVSASRSILYAHREKKYADRFGSDWQKCVEQAVKDMKEDINRVIAG
ncbi:MAG TPA: orotidine-5'-phosphate decarboxylase [Tepidisphaeraceae bacterium]|jgi:orotidine-5'-phosphate decarboxylase|nr:orotidine-5'-phosphate decarboxylase [Tepidisphaeraceae bacterium]